MYKRFLFLDKHPTESFFLWGPRQTGKSSLLKTTYPTSHYIDLLNSDTLMTFRSKPWLLREQLLADPELTTSSGQKKIVIIDEIQKVPHLLDEVHWLIENKRMVFGLCGSSARKVKRGHANLLGGRALRYELFGLVSLELGHDFELTRLLNRGYFPKIYQSAKANQLLRSYCLDYLKEEIADEGLVRNLPAFSQFLEAAALGDGEIVEFTPIARECGVSASAVKGYFEILNDTLLASFLPAYTKRPKRRTVSSPKFYFCDVGIVNFLAKRGELTPGSMLFGKAFENWVYHELKAHQHYRELYSDLSYWRLSTGVEVDFIVGNMEQAIETKASAHITADHLKGLRELKKDYPHIQKRWVVSLEKAPRLTEDGIEILPYTHFAKRLWED